MAAAQREVWTRAQLWRLLAERAVLHLSAASVSALFSKQPSQVVGDHGAPGQVPDPGGHPRCDAGVEVVAVEVGPGAPDRGLRRQAHLWVDSQPGPNRVRAPAATAITKNFESG